MVPIQQPKVALQHPSWGVSVQPGAEVTALRCSGVVLRDWMIGSIPTPLPFISLMDGHLTKTRGGKMGQLRPKIRFCVPSSGTGDDRAGRFQPSTDLSASICSYHLSHLSSKQFSESVTLNSGHHRFPFSPSSAKTWLIADRMHTAPAHFSAE